MRVTASEGATAGVGGLAMSAVTAGGLSKRETFGVEGGAGIATGPCCSASAVGGGAMAAMIRAANSGSGARGAGSAGAAMGAVGGGGAGTIGAGCGARGCGLARPSGTLSRTPDGDHVMIGFVMTDARYGVVAEIPNTCRMMFGFLYRPCFASSAAPSRR